MFFNNEKKNEAFTENRTEHAGINPGILFLVAVFLLIVTCLIGDVALFLSEGLPK